jgi:hypothetical protein
MRIRDPGWKKFETGTRDGKHSDPGSGINIPYPQHWYQWSYTKGENPYNRYEYQILKILPHYNLFQCCGSGIRCLFDLLIQDLGWVKKQDSDPGWTTRIIFPRPEKPIFWVKNLKNLNYLMRIRDPGWKKFGSGSGINIMDPQHWYHYF